MNDLNKDKYTWRNVIIYSLIGTIIIIGVLSFPIFQLQDRLNNLQENNEHLVHMESFSDGYENTSDDTIQIRYRYVLDNERADSVNPEDWDNENTLFSLYENGLLVSSDYLYSEFTTVIPDVSRTYSLRPGEISDVQFDVMLNKDAEEFRDLVRFEVEIVVEEFKNGRWSPVYQVNFMERGPNWRLNKGLIELPVN